MSKIKGYGDMSQPLTEWLQSVTPSSVLDIGAGSGNTGRLAREAGVNRVDAIEIFGPYIEDFMLGDVYDEIFHGNALNLLPGFKSLGAHYAVITMVDVFEHFTTDEAIELLKWCSLVADHIVVVVPWNYKQGPVKHNGEINLHEQHMQNDLTFKVMAERYPKLKCHRNGKRMGMYTWTREVDDGKQVAPTKPSTEPGE